MVRYNGRLPLLLDPPELTNSMTDETRQWHTQLTEDCDPKERYWSDAAEAVKIYHDELVDGWKEEMDTLLVYVSWTYVAGYKQL